MNFWPRVWASWITIPVFNWEKKKKPGDRGGKGGYNQFEQQPAVLKKEAHRADLVLYFRRCLLGEGGGG